MEVMENNGMTQPIFSWPCMLLAAALSYPVHLDVLQHILKHTEPATRESLNLARGGIQLLQRHLAFMDFRAVY